MQVALGCKCGNFGGYVLTNSRKNWPPRPKTLTQVHVQRTNTSEWLIDEVLNGERNEHLQPTYLPIALPGTYFFSLQPPLPGF